MTQSLFLSPAHRKCSSQLDVAAFELAQVFQYGFVPGKAASLNPCRPISALVSVAIWRIGMCTCC